ncbi:MAG: glutamate--tRNA ligase [Patescibacteria group bacterium]
MIRLRFAPSPTGELHIGSARTALYNFLLAQKLGGEFILRIEDTDQERFVEGSQDRILAGLKWLGLKWQEGPDVGGKYGPYVQSERLTLYKKYADDLITSGAAYYCFCTESRLSELRAEQEAKKLAPRYDRACLKLSAEDVDLRLKKSEPFVIRLKIPEGTTVFRDIIRGEMSIDNSTIDDQVLLKSDGYPTYHLACIVDDHLMEITHVVRGEEWLPSTVKHIILYQALGWTAPEFAHLPNILNKSKAKLSKRKDGEAVWLQTYQKQGYLPEAMVNFLAFMGWHPSDEQEFFDIPELVESFSLERVQKAGAIFDTEKLKWFNAQYIKKLSVADLDQRLQAWYAPLMAMGRPVANTLSLTKVLQSRLEILSEATANGAWFFSSELNLDKNLLVSASIDTAETIKALEYFKQKIVEMGEWEAGKIKTDILAAAEADGWPRKNLLWPVRVALTGEKFSPDVFEVTWGLGKEVTIERLYQAIKVLQQ